MKKDLIQQLASMMAKETVKVFAADCWQISTFTRWPALGYDTMDINGDADFNFRIACSVFDRRTADYLDITLTIGHEMGHWMTREYYNKTEQLRKYDREVEEATPKTYPYIDAEKAATLWGIKWILTHPKEVTQFENAWRLAS